MKFIGCMLRECPFKDTTAVVHCVTYLPDGTPIFCCHAILEDEKPVEPELKINIDIRIDGK